jgi:hypothetical protein
MVDLSQRAGLASVCSKLRAKHLFLDDPNRKRKRNYTPNVFCYAAKERTELESAGHLVFTYACNSTQASDVSNNHQQYEPLSAGSCATVTANDVRNRG